MENKVLFTAIGTGGTRGWRNERHERIDRLYLIHGGEGSYTIDGVTHPFRKGLSYYLPWNVDYSLSQNDDVPLQHTYINFICSKPSVITHVLEMKNEDCVYFGPIFSMIVSLVSIVSKEHHPGFACFSGSIDTLACAPLLETCILQLMDFMTDTYHMERLGDPDMIRVLSYIHAHYSEKLSIDKLATVACLNSRYFISKFRKYVHCTPYQYILTLRYDMALSMHKNGMPLQQAAEQVGFSSAASLYRMMKQ